MKIQQINEIVEKVIYNYKSEYLTSILEIPFNPVRRDGKGRELNLRSEGFTKCRSICPEVFFLKNWRKYGYSGS